MVSVCLPSDALLQHLPSYLGFSYLGHGVYLHYFANKGSSSQGYGFSCGHVWIWELDCEEGWAPKNWCFWTVVLEKTLGLQGDPTSPFWRRLALGLLWREWCWSCNSNTLATSCKELTHWKRLCCWEGLGAGGEGDDRGWDGWMASLTRWTWVWVNSGSWWWTGRPGVVRFMGSRRVGHDWATELSWALEEETQERWSISLSLSLPRKNTVRRQLLRSQETDLAQRHIQNCAKSMFVASFTQSMVVLSLNGLKTPYTTVFLSFIA